MGQSGIVVAIHLQADRESPPRPVDEARALVGRGLDGDYHGKSRPNSARQVLLADRRALESVGFAPGALREQVTVDFEGLDAVPAGARLRVGDAELEVTGPCEPCRGIGQINRVSDPETLRLDLVGRRGILAVVVGVAGAGLIRRGDVVAVVDAAPAAP